MSSANGDSHAYPILGADAFGTGHLGVFPYGSAGPGRDGEAESDARRRQQNPPVTTKGKGTAALTFDTATKKLSWNVKYSGLSGPATAGHIHGPAAMGENAGVAIPFKGKLKSPIKGSVVLTDAQAADLMAGKDYVNVHTAANKDGEIRGQVEAAK